VVLRFPSFIRRDELITHAVESLLGLTEGDIKGNIVIIEPDRTRIRKSQT
jgi:hypothetical protein